MFLQLINNPNHPKKVDWLFERNVWISLRNQKKITFEMVYLLLLNNVVNFKCNIFLVRSFSYRQLNWKKNLIQSFRGKYCLIHLENCKETYIITLKSYLKQDNVAPTQQYIVLIRLQRKISSALLRLLQFLSDLKNTISLHTFFNEDKCYRNKLSCLFIKILASLDQAKATPRSFRKVFSVTMVVLMVVVVVMVMFFFYNWCWSCCWYGGKSVLEWPGDHLIHWGEDNIKKY